MKNKNIVNFWVGFLVASVATALLYWLLRSKRQITPPPVILEQKQTRTISLAEKTISEPKQDDLTKITGIGPTYARLLNENGIYSFEDLAHTSPEEIQAITGLIRWDPADWIQQASDFLVNR